MLVFLLYYPHYSWELYCINDYGYNFLSNTGSCSHTSHKAAWGPRNKVDIRLFSLVLCVLSFICNSCLVTAVIYFISSSGQHFGPADVLKHFVNWNDLTLKDTLFGLNDHLYVCM